MAAADWRGLAPALALRAKGRSLDLWSDKFVDSVFMWTMRE
jgi:hypothetical protein